jgi:NADH dehydrogenase (ubiquinone) 1 alpha subcomplex subunit 9
MDRLICDPPFLSEDCQTKGDAIRDCLIVFNRSSADQSLLLAAMTVRWLAKPSEPVNMEQARLIVCTGERMESLVTKLYRSFNLKTTTFEPVHTRGLSNEFYCYANFTSSKWAWRGG